MGLCHENHGQNADLYRQKTIEMGRGSLVTDDLVAGFMFTENIPLLPNPN